MGPQITHSWSRSCRSARWPRSPAASYSWWHWSTRDSEEPGLQGESVRGPDQHGEAPRGVPTSTGRPFRGPRQTWGGPSGDPDQHGEAPKGVSTSTGRPLRGPPQTWGGPSGTQGRPSAQLRKTPPGQSHECLRPVPSEVPQGLPGLLPTHSLSRWEGHPCPLGPWDHTRRRCLSLGKSRGTVRRRPEGGALETLLHRHRSVWDRLSPPPQGLSWHGS